MSRRFRESFARKMIRADHRLDEPLLGSFPRISDDKRKAEYYLELGKDKRSQLISNRVFYLLIHAFGIVGVGSVLVRWMSRTVLTPYPVADSNLAETLVLGGFFLLLIVFAWFALNSISTHHPSRSFR